MFEVEPVVAGNAVALQRLLQRDLPELRRRGRGVAFAREQRRVPIVVRRAGRFVAKAKRLTLLQLSSAKATA